MHVLAKSADHPVIHGCTAVTGLKSRRTTSEAARAVCQSTTPTGRRHKPSVGVAAPHLKAGSSIVCFSFDLDGDIYHHNPGPRARTASQGLVLWWSSLWCQAYANRRPFFLFHLYGWGPLWVLGSLSGHHLGSASTFWGLTADHGAVLLVSPAGAAAGACLARVGSMSRDRVTGAEQLPLPCPSTRPPCSTHCTDATPRPAHRPLSQCWVCCDALGMQ